MMKKSIINISLLAVLMSGAGGCKKFLDVNNNQNIATSTNALYVFTGALGNTYRHQVSTNVNIIPGSWTGFYAHSTSYTSGGAEKTYSYTNADFNAFSESYNILADYQYVIKYADQDGIGYFKDAANIMQCYIFQMLVDMYGDIPYEDALVGKGNIMPVYTDQKKVYEDLIKRLDAAIASIKTTTWSTDAFYTGQDILFKGDKTKWIRFANTLKLRILMRQSFMANRDTYIKDNIQTTLAEGYLLENVFCTPGYQNIGGKLNPFYFAYGYNEINTVQTGHQLRKVNRVIVNWLKNSQDTFRLQSLAWPKGTTPVAVSFNLPDYVGVPLGAGSGYSTKNSSPIGPFQVKMGEGIRPGIMMTAAEALFLQAEAAERYAIAFPGGSSQQLYEAGIKAHFRLCASPTSTTGSATGDEYANRYMNRPIANVNWASSPDKIKAILIQKWVSLCHVNGLEAWSEYRKSSGSASVGVPASVKSITAGASDPEPARYYYPLEEENANGLHTPKNINAFTSKIFWDVN